MATQNYHPHMVVGNITKIPTTTVQNFLVTHQIEATEFINELINESENSSSSLSDFKNIAQTLINANNIVNSNQELYDLFPQFNELIEMITANSEDVFSFIQSENLTSVISEESGIWDSLIAHFINNKNSSLIQNLTYFVKLIGLLKKIDNHTISTNTEVLDFWKKATVVYPNPPFPLPKPEAENLPEPPENSEMQNNFAELASLDVAREEIVSLFDFQLQQNKNNKLSETDFKASLQFSTSEDFEAEPSESDPVDLDDAYSKYASEKDPDVLVSDFSNQISADTQSVLEGLSLTPSNLNVKFATSRIDSKINKLTGVIAAEAMFDKVVMIGDVLVSVDSAVYEDLICTPEQTFSHCDLLHQLTQANPDKTYVQVLGIGYANIIRQNLLRYEADEVAHIENILAGEKKEKTHRNLKIKEDFTSTETEKNEETETDTKSTDRFELSKEVSKLSTSASQFEAGLNVSGSYGMVSFDANVGYASQKSSSEASATAVKNAKELTERAISRIQERVLEKRSSTTINEVEVTNVHGVDNTGSTEHISGFYYWVDKVYNNQIYNIGKRLMLEFMVPEPAAYHIYNEAFSKREGVTLTKPINPKEYTQFEKPLTSHKDITRSNYNLWAALYNVQDATPPPEDYLTVSKAYALDYTASNKGWYNKEYNDLEIKQGYVAHTAFLRIATSHGSGNYISGYIGRKHFGVNRTAAIPSIRLDDETDLVPLSFRGKFTEFSMNVEILCKLSERGLENWQLQTYNSILNAYNTLKAEYDYQVSNLESGVNISGQNPILNRKTEQTELKKWGLELLTLQRFNGFNAMKRSKNGHPEIDFTEAFNEGKFVRFFEQSIEWHNMTYLFYPYFWSPKQRWSITKQLSDTDSKFTDFLQAGYARVVVPVHPKFTDAILHYLNTGEIWEGEDLPAIDDELYLSVTDEIREAEDNTQGVEHGDSWETRIPTNMVMLSDVIPEDLPGSGA